MVCTHPPVGFSRVLKTLALETVLLQSLHEYGQVISLFKLHSPRRYNEKMSIYLIGLLSIKCINTCEVPRTEQAQYLV